MAEQRNESGRGNSALFMTSTAAHGFLQQRCNKKIILVRFCRPSRSYQVEQAPAAFACAVVYPMHAERRLRPYGSSVLDEMAKEFDAALRNIVRDAAAR